MGSCAEFSILESICLVLILNNFVSSFKSNVYLLWNTLDNMNKGKTHSLSQRIIINAQDWKYFSVLSLCVSKYGVYAFVCTRACMSRSQNRVLENNSSFFQIILS